MKRSPYGSRVLVTGVTGGIGLSIARLFMQNGFQVAGCSRHKSDVLPPGLLWFPMDVSDDASVRICVEQAAQALGGIDILIHCAGMGLGGSVEDISAEELAYQLDINTLGFVRTAQAVLPGMRAQKKGLLLPISSIAGFISIPYQSSYSASKFALEALVQALRMEARPFGIQACLIEPGDTKTGFTGARRLCTQVQPCYQAPMTAAISKMERDEQQGKSPDTVAKTALKLAYCSRVPIRRAVGASYRMIRILCKLLPDRLAEFIVRRLYLHNGSPKGETVKAHPDDRF